MAESIVTVSEQRFYAEATTSWALKAMAEERGLNFVRIDLDDFKRRNWKSANNPLIVLHAAHIKIACLTIGDIKGFYPDSKVVVLGSDSLYYTRKIPDFHSRMLVDIERGMEYCGAELVDLHLDLMDEGVDGYRRNGVKADRWYWTASRDGLRIAEEVAVEPRGLQQSTVICYGNPNVSAPGFYRYRLTRELSNRGRSIQLGGTTDFVTLDEIVLRDIYRLYRKSNVCLGTSSPSWPAYRGAKGWRDWIAPSLGVPLIYDDLPEASDGVWPAALSKPPMDVFSYEDWDGLERLLTAYDNHYYRDQMVKKQKDWITEHIIECQFERIFSHYKLW